MIQAADLVGHHGLTYLLVLVNTLLALLLCEVREAGRKPLALAGPVVAVLVLAAVYSTVRWHQVERLMAGAGRMTIGVVQGNIDQSEKWSPDNQLRTMHLYLELSRTLAGKGRPELVVWPETALPFYPQTFPDISPLWDLTRRYDTALLTGAPWFERTGEEPKKIIYYNSAQLLVPDGTYGGAYHKSHLVPFGEYVPMKKLLPFLAPLVEAVGDFSPGAVTEPLAWKSARIGVLICFESIFPDIARKWSEQGANVLVNLTNDAWYGKSSAPYHSMAMTVLRAVETRRSVVRSANTGISGFIDPLGRVDTSSPIFVTWAATDRVALLGDQTVFVRWGYRFPGVCLVVGGVAWLLAGRRKRLPTNR
jgi:apolipoprotein N-acyltransferase